VPGRRIVRRFLALERSKKLLLIEAVYELLMASAAIRLLQFQRVLQIAARPLSGKVRADIRGAVWSIEAAAAYVPWKTVCFQKGLALQAMLRRRGIDAQLHYGVNFDSQRSVRAHVWVSADGDIVIGGKEAPEFRVLTSMPSRGAERS
jgi:hypothetical protein